MKLSFHIAPISFRGGLKHVQYYIKYKAVLGMSSGLCVHMFRCGHTAVQHTHGGLQKCDVARKWIYIN
jgi:hypothetical protein